MRSMSHKCFIVESADETLSRSGMHDMVRIRLGRSHVVFQLIAMPRRYLAPHPLGKQAPGLRSTL
jgi:hypothetical protein